MELLDNTSRSATITWRPPASNGGADLTGYVLEKKLAASPKWEKVATVDPSVYTYTFEKLKDRQEYLFRVFAENSAGLSTPASTALVSLDIHASKLNCFLCKQNTPVGFTTPARGRCIIFHI